MHAETLKCLFFSFLFFAVAAKSSALLNKIESTQKSNHNEF